MENSIDYKQSRKKFKHEYASSVYLQVVGSGAHGAPRSLYVFTEHCRYFFNCGEGTQRLAAEHKVKLGMLEHVLITHKSWENVGGLPGALLTMQDSGIPSITIHGPPGVESLYNDTRHFLRFNDLSISYSHYENNRELKQEGSLHIQAVPLWPQVSSREYETIDHAQQQSAEKVEDMFAHERNCKAEIHAVDSRKNIEESIKCKDLAIAYICRPVAKPGALLPHRCRELGVPVGPLMGELKRGNDVTLENGNVVKASDVTEPPDCSGVFIVIEVPTKSHLSDLANCPAFSKHQENGATKPGDIANIIVHFTPVEVINEPSYIEWIKNFPDSTKHIYINENSACMGSEGVHKIQYKLNHLFPDSFALLHEAGRFPRSAQEREQSAVKRQRRDSYGEEKEPLVSNGIKDLNENHLQAFTCLTYHIRPRLGIDVSKRVEINPEEYIRECYGADEFRSTYEVIKEKINEVKRNIDPSLKEKIYPNVLFLGTGSCIPNKTRNTSGIALNISSSSAMLFDCGEGTFGQLVRYMGPVSAEQFLRNLSVIYISHLHADHHIGLIRVLLARKRALNKVLVNNEKVPKLMLLAPGGIIHYLTSFSANFESLLDQFSLLPNHCFREKYDDDQMKNNFMSFCEKSLVGIQHIRTCFVPHCPNAFGVALALKCGWKFAYSGDTMPCQEFVNIGTDCDLLIHEATMEDELKEDAKLKKHSTTSEAIKIGIEMKAKYIILTHFSQRYAKVPLLDHVPQNVGVAFDNMLIHLWNLPCLSHLYPAYVKVFSEDVDEMLKKTMKIKNRKL